MNEALPRWRSFTSAAVEPSPAAQPPEPGEPAVEASAQRPAIVLMLGILGGAAAGAALVLLGAVVLGLAGSEPSSGASGPIGTGPAPAGLATLVRESGAWPDGSDPGFARGAVEIVVDVAGAVTRPGILRLHEGDRIADAIAAAGGYGPRVDLAAAARSLNLAQPLTDGGKVVVPELGMDPIAAGAPGAGTAAGLIDLNTADQAVLESLPGIGPVTAGKIMAARGEQPFTAVDDLLERGLVGDSVFEDIVAQVRVGG